VGYNAGSNISGDQNTFIGAISGSVTTSGTGNTSCGYGSGPSAATTANSTALGNNATTSANNTVALGANVANSTADTALIGDSTAYIVRSAGYFRSAVVYSTKAGRTSGTQTVTFPGPVTLTIGSTQWDNREGGSSNVSGNTILMPQVGRQYLVTAFFRTSAVTGAAIGHAVYRLKVDDNGTVTTIGESTVTTAAATTTEVAAGVSGQYITVNANAFCYSELERISGTTTSFTVDFYGLCSTRLA
jgi:hypothetical protein